jgi:hypothetical protein
VVEVVVFMEVVEPQGELEVYIMEVADHLIFPGIVDVPPRY